jgi:glycosyltransferase involved in cell wall biosynthesis
MTENLAGRAGTLVLSPLPLTNRARRLHADGGMFMDVATMRRGGLAAALRSLRSCGVSTVIVTGEEGDLAVFRDVLCLMAFAIPRAERWYAAPDGKRLRLRWTSVPVSLGRIGCGILAGFNALVGNWIRLNRLCAGGQSLRQRAPAGRKCLYLKSALGFGTPIGGSVGHVAGVANALHRAGKELRLVAVSEQPLIDPEIKQVFVPPHTLTAYPHELNRFRYHRKYLRAVLSETARFRPDFIYQRYSLNDLTGIFVRRKLGIPLVLEYNGSETWAQRHWGDPLLFQAIAERIEAANLRQADLVVVVSEEIRKQVCSIGVREDRVLFYPNCVDLAIFDPGRFDQEALEKVRRELGVPAGADLFTFVGTFGQWHGTETLAAAIRQLIECDREFLRSRGVHFLLVGDGVCGEKVRSILKDAPYVSLPGFRPQGETPAILAASDVCLSPHVPNPDGTPFFGSPTKLFEYMSMAKPIVASDLDQIGWILRGWRPGEPAPSTDGRDRSAAILVDPGSLDSLIGGIRRAAAMDAAARAELGERARSLILQSFTWDKNVRAVLDRFDTLLGASSDSEKS